ncbi:hypothetical protein FNU76_06375 [Chitinimonas arctica]|uniref:Secretion system X translation initiation factor n=1 Tax=Chitinimonas arctica TaxID=2594795 RepID=A0A516SBZ0_9NEIS|nr:hypothetical protein [Chitinimonas arctica]QDQ25661.1 hypothetical protein FNU76_04455 [Chitinimonas arctica]QDQ26007.1 hypothetical protein FNU76_06375 [Chitinimonas arctica]
MDNAARRRWMIWAGLLAATLVAIVYPVEEDEVELVEGVLAPGAARPLLVKAASVTTPPLAPAAPLLAVADPFAPRNWQAPPPVAAPIPNPVQEAELVGPPPPPPRPAPPALPFRYMGSFNDGGAQVMYLSHDEQTLLARPGDTLEGRYKVLRMDAQHIEFEYLPTGDKQILPIAASE